MKIKFAFIFAIVWISNFKILSQTFEFGLTYNTTNATFYKNVPGIEIGFIYDFNNQYIFTELSRCWKNNDFYEHGVSFPNVYVREVDGNFTSSFLKIGLAQKILNTKEISISAGGFASANYFKFDDDLHIWWINPFEESAVYIRDRRNEQVKNKIGFGGFLDLELKGIVFENTSIFSRFSGDFIQYDGKFYKPFSIDNILRIGFELGLRINLKNIKPAPNKQ